MIPLVFIQLNATAKVAKAAPEINYIYQLLQRSLGQLPHADYSGRMAK